MCVCVCVCKRERDMQDDLCTVLCTSYVGQYKGVCTTYQSCVLTSAPQKKPKQASKKIINLKQVIPPTE